MSALRERLAYLTRMIALIKAEEERLADVRRSLEDQREKIAAFIEMYEHYLPQAAEDKAA